MKELAIIVLVGLLFGLCLASGVGIGYSGL